MMHCLALLEHNCPCLAIKHHVRVGVREFTCPVFRTFTGAIFSLFEKVCAFWLHLSLFGAYHYSRVRSIP